MVIRIKFGGNGEEIGLAALEAGLPAVLHASEWCSLKLSGPTGPEYGKHEETGG